ncbi:MAG: thioredoxin domain-containing protein [Candidatus Magasanikbacteria bacterium]
MIKPWEIILIFIPALAIAGWLFLSQFNVFLPKQEILANTPQDEQNSITIYADDPVIGSPTAKITLIAFENFTCDTCKATATILEELMQRYPKSVRIIWKGVSNGEENEKVHEYAYCANSLKQFYPFYVLAFTNSEILSEDTLQKIRENIKVDKKAFDTCIESDYGKQKRQQAERMAIANGIKELPTIYFNDTLVPNMSSLEEWIQYLGL